MRKKYPIRFFLSETFPHWLSNQWDKWAHTPWYRLKCRFWYKFNVVKVKTLSPTWCDRDLLLVHAAFQILTDFVEKEEPWQWKATDEEFRKMYEHPWVEEDASFVSEASVRHAANVESDLQNWKKLRALDAWWKEVLSQAEKFDDIPTTTSPSYEDITEKLVELASLRKYLWT